MSKTTSRLTSAAEGGGETPIAGVIWSSRESIVATAVECRGVAASVGVHSM